MKTLSSGLLTLVLTGCAGQQAGQDPFARQAEFEARRQLETTVLPGMDQATASVHVTEVLMDLDCVLTKVDSELGLLFARSERRLIEAGGPLTMPRWWEACGGSDVTVSVNEGEYGTVEVRAAFDPSSPEASHAFRTLLRRSVAREAARPAEQESRP
ncbi:MAG TPA: hypothetical protein VLA56_17660 [Pseudomonadales bacterium]|nr:hypothetical protein [Pseudomonadales bacterium]